MTKSTYDTIGKTYDKTRTADPEIINKLKERLAPKINGRYLDLGCGSGNYTGGLAERGLTIEGLDISNEMLNKAKKKYPALNFHQGDASQLPFQDKMFDGIICILATHHIANNLKAFQEAYRILTTGQFVIFTATPNQMKKYWLYHYFPEMIEHSMNMMTNFDKLKHDLEQAGFENVQSTPFFVTNQLQDLFLQAGKYRPEIYLNEAVRQGISSFHLSINPAQLKSGLEKLEADIESGKIKQIISHYENDLGDYLFVTAQKF